MMIIAWLDKKGDGGGEFGKARGLKGDFRTRLKVWNEIPRLP